MAIKMGPYGYLTYLSASDSLVDSNVNNAGMLAYAMDTGIWSIYDGSDWVNYEPPGQAGERSHFIANLLQITGDTRLLFLPRSTNTTTSTDQSRNAQTITHNATAAGRLSRVGKGYALAFDGSTNYSTAPDAAGLSFGDASTDVAHSWLALVKITDTANNRTLFGKFTTNQREYRAYINTTDTLLWAFYDESTDATDQRASNAAVTQGAYVLLGGVFNGTDGANGMTLYQNAAVIASTATTDSGGTYTAMENGTSVLGIGAGTSSASLPFQGDIAMIALCAGALTADQMWQIKQLVNGYFGLSL